MKLNKKRLVALATNIHRVIDEFVVPGLSPKDQAELIAMGLRMSDLRIRPDLVFGRVWIADKQLLHPMIQGSQGIRFLPNHFWTEVEGIILDYTFRSVVNQNHESIPGGIFTRGTFRGYIHEVDASIRYRSSKDAIQKLRLKPKLLNVYI